MPTIGGSKGASYPHGYASYAPGSKRKLNVFEDKECLLEVLGSNDGEPIQEWRPEDRVIDVTGREYRLVKQPGKKGYDMDPTGETWSCERLLNVAEADAQLLKRDPATIRRRVNDAPEDKRMAVLMKAIDELPIGVWWFWPVFFLFLILFFLAVVFVAGKFFMWLSTRYQWHF
jgi:hypothetical protein